MSGSDETGQARGASKCDDNGAAFQQTGLNLRCSERRKMFSFSWELGEGEKGVSLLASICVAGWRSLLWAKDDELLFFLINY